MKKFVLSVILVVVLAFQSVAFAEDSNHVNPPGENENIVLPLNEKQKEQLQYEKTILILFSALLTNIMGVQKVSMK